MARIYEELSAQQIKPVTCRQLAKAGRCGKNFAHKLIKELQQTQTINNPRDKKQRRDRGIGSKCLSSEDEEYLLKLRTKFPGRTLREYRRRLFRQTGHDVSINLICQWFLKNHPYRAAMRKTNPVPIAKFTARNQAKFDEYVSTVGGIDPMKLKFADEKSLKGIELFGLKNRADPYTGIVPGKHVPPDYRVKYSIIGLCGIDETMPPLVYTISQQNTTGAIFMDFIEEAVGKGHLKTNDVLVLDNAAWHCRGEASDLEEFLWDCPDSEGNPMHILVVFLPAYAPELNPIELCWHMFVRKYYGKVDWLFMRGQLKGKHAIAYCAMDAMETLTHCDVAKCFAKDGYL
jgi:transposase